MTIYKVFDDLYYNDFRTFRNVYHSLSSVYIQFLKLPTTFPKFSLFFFLNDTATTEFYPLPLHAALPISAHRAERREPIRDPGVAAAGAQRARSDERRGFLRSRLDFSARARHDTRDRSRIAARDDRLVPGRTGIRGARYRGRARDRALAGRSRSCAALGLGTPPRAGSGKGSHRRSATRCRTGYPLRHASAVPRSEHCHLRLAIQ